jgi:hypothetical protein
VPSAVPAGSSSAEAGLKRSCSRAKAASASLRLPEREAAPHAMSRASHLRRRCATSRQASSPRPRARRRYIEASLGRLPRDPLVLFWPRTVDRFAMPARSRRCLAPRSTRGCERLRGQTADARNGRAARVSSRRSSRRPRWQTTPRPGTRSGRSPRHARAGESLLGDAVSCGSRPFYREYGRGVHRHQSPGGRRATDLALRRAFHPQPKSRDLDPA